MAVNRGLYLILLLILVSVNVNGQIIDLSKPIRVKSGLISLDSALRATSLQAGVVFSYNSKKINTKQRIDLGGNEFTLAQFLSQLEKKDLKIKIIENYIVLSPRIEKTIEVKPKEKKLASIKPQQLKVITKQEKKRVQSEDDIHFENPRVQASSQPTIEQLLVVTPKPKIKVNPSIIFAAPSKKETEKKPAVKAKPKKAQLPYFGRYGLSADETTLLGAAGQFGFDYLFAVVSVNTSFESSQFRYGLGSSFNLNKNTKILLNFNLGNVERSGHFTDTSGVSNPIQVKSKLTRASIALEFPVAQRIKLQVGPLFNYLQTTYYINSQPSNLQQFNSEGDKLFYAIKAPYVITNTFSPNKDSNIKTWVGLQINLFYSINFKLQK
ncbi:MAG: hypothetical protein QM734_09790 [Cyclobacteriaceae bacterium]